MLKTVVQNHSWQLHSHVTHINLGKYVDLLVRMDKLNTGQVYCDSVKIQVRCILRLGKLQADIFQFYRF